ncbi:hypothetical protein [Fluviicola sp.]|uniref:hypothetical protein n=1 Tax=Fluviicola sp. TaxID=1917219 RepID=UPI00282A47EF|nr:hypothetical protein [Fluviicola sp.]MDR0802369.1 hypothetical protein [Fluviicola sp.]
MIPLLRKTVCVLLTGFGCCGNSYGQGDSLVPSIKKENLTAFYIIDRVYTDPRNPDKRLAVGAANFFQIEDGMLSVAARMPKMTFLFMGKIDSAKTDVVDHVSVLRFYTTNSYGNGTIYPYVFEISQQGNNGNILIYSCRLRTTADQYYFEAHVASSKEIEQVRENVSENPRK